jgi:hypothetical protein
MGESVRANSKPAELFWHVSAEKHAFYRSIMDVFAAAKRLYSSEGKKHGHDTTPA